MLCGIIYLFIYNKFTFEGFSVSKFKTFIQNGLHTKKFQNKENDDTYEKAISSDNISDIKHKVKKMPKVSFV